MRALILIFAGIFLSVSAFAESFELTTSRGSIVHGEISVPPNFSGPAPAFVLAPGQGYHMDLPLLKGLAEKAAALGVIVYRFNWAYFTAVPRGRPSEGLVGEGEDMRAVLELARKDPRVDSKRIAIAGKSLGTYVSWSLFRKEASLAGLLLLTPICSDSDNHDKPIGDESYPGFGDETRLVHFVLGNADPACSLPVLYDFLKGTKGNASVSVFAGGHSLTYGQAGDPANVLRDAKNMEAAVVASARWVEILLGN